MLRTRHTVFITSSWRAAPLQPLVCRSSRCSVPTHVSCLLNVCGGSCNAAWRSTRHTESSCAGVGSLMHVKRGDLLLTRFRQGEQGSDEAEAAAAAGGLQERHVDDELAMCGMPGFELCVPAPLNTIPIVFSLHKHCPFGHSFALVGETEELGDWDTSKPLKLQWSDGDVWASHAMLPVHSAVAFKYIQLGPDGKVVSWGQDVAGGGNITVTVEPTDELVSGYRVTLDPPMENGPLTARLDVVAMLPMSGSFYQRKGLAVAAGMHPTEAEDFLTDKALVEQGLISQDKFVARWPQEIRSLKLEPEQHDASDEETGSRPDSQHQATAPTADHEQPAGAAADLLGLDSTSALAGAVAAGTAPGRAQSLAGAVAAGGGLAQVVDQDTGSSSSSSGGSSSNTSAAAGRMITSMDVIEGDGSSTEDDHTRNNVSNAQNNMSADDESDWVPSGPTQNASQPAKHDSLTSLQIKPAAISSSEVCPPPPKHTKLVSAGPSISTIDVDATPVAASSIAVYEVAEGSLEPVDPIHVQQGIALGQGKDKGAAPAPPRVQVSSDMALGVTMRGDDPLSLPSYPEVAAVRGAQAPQGFDTEAKRLGQDEGLLVPPQRAPGSTANTATDATSSSDRPRVKITVDQHMSVSMRGEDPLSLPDVPEVAAMRGAQAPTGFVDSSTAVGPDEGLLVPPGITAADAEQKPGEDVPFEMKKPKGFGDVKTPAGVEHEAKGLGSHEQLLAPPEQAQAAGLAAQAEGLDAQDATMTQDDERLAAATAAAAAAAAATVRYAGGAAAARVQEAKSAVDERSKLLEGADATPVDQVMSEAQVIADAARSEAELSGVQEAAEVLREAARDKQEQQQGTTTTASSQGEQGSNVGDWSSGSYDARDSGSSSSSRGGRKSGRGGWLKRMFSMDKE